MLEILDVFSFSVASAVAQAASPAASAAQPPFGEILMKMLPMFVIVFVVFHFFIIRPQRQKELFHAELLKGLKAGENVITTSGILGKVSAVASDYITLEVANGVKIKIQPNHIVGKESDKK